MFLEVGVEREAFFEIAEPHDLKTRTIDKTELAPRGSEKSRDRCLMKGCVNPDDFEHGEDFAVQCANSIHSQSTLDECERFKEHVARGQQRNVLLKKLSPSVCSFCVTAIIGVENRQQC